MNEYQVQFNITNMISDLLLYILPIKNKIDNLNKNIFKYIDRVRRINPEINENTNFRELNLKIKNKESIFNSDFVKINNILKQSHKSIIDN